MSTPSPVLTARVSTAALPCPVLTYRPHLRARTAAQLCWAEPDIARASSLYVGGTDGTVALYSLDGQRMPGVARLGSPVRRASSCDIVRRRVSS